MSDDETTAGDDAVDSVDYRQVAFVVLAAFALVVAAFAAPVATGTEQPGAGDGSGGQDGGDRGSGDGSGDGGSGDRGQSDDSPGLSFDWGELLDRLFGNGDSGPGDRPGTDSQCTISLDSDPIPGSQVTVTVRYDGEPLAGAPVWFNDRRIGETDREGRVTGQVPYETELRVRVGIQDRPACRTVERLPTGSTRTSLVGATGRVLAVEAQSSNGSNATATYPVEGEVVLAVRGEPYPGENVTVDASIRGVPFRGAAVAVDGERVGRTDANGSATILVPADGSERFEVSVSRGDFRNATTVEVLLLDVSLRPEHLALLPGTGATVRASVAGEPVAGADVAVDGAHRGTTDADGELFVELPVDPTAPVTVDTERQSASASLVGVYGPLALVLAVVGSAAGAVAYRVRGARGGAAVLGGLLALVLAWAFVVVAEALWGLPGLAAAVGVLAALVLVGALVRWRGELSERTATGYRLLERLLAWLVGLVGRPERLLAAVAGLGERVVQWLLARVLGIVVGLEELLDWLARGAGRLASWVGSLRSLPGRFLTAVRGPSLAKAAAVVAAALALAGGYVVADTRGTGAVAAGLAVAALAYWLYTRNRGGRAREAADAAASSTAATPTTATAAGATTADRSSFREVWRAFARLVVPDRWQSQTPEEVAHTAIEQGYPSGPVQELTTLFSEVEYGGRSLSEAVRERAAEVYDEVVAGEPGHRPDEPGKEGDGP